MIHTILSYIVIIGLFLGLFCKYKKDIELNRGGYYIDLASSTALKGVCAICLICTHWCTYNLHLIEENTFTRFIPFHLGHFCIIIFMFLSGYGVVSVELKKRRKWAEYLKKRCWKILKPAWLVSLLTLVLYMFWGPKDISMETVGENWLHEYMSQISHKEFSAFFFAKYFILHLDWYVATTLVLYLLLKIALSLTNDTMKMFGMLVLLVALFYIIGRTMHFPAHYYRNLWSFLLGVLCAIRPHWTRNGFIATAVIVVFALNSFVEGVNYTVAAIMALIVLMYIGYTNKNHRINSSFLLYLGSTSYAVYLIHRTVYNLLWTYQLLYMPLFVVVTLILAHLFTKYILKKQ